jgi:hypothetical protein
VREELLEFIDSGLQRLREEVLQQQGQQPAEQTQSQQGQRQGAGGPGPGPGPGSRQAPAGSPAEAQAPAAAEPAAHQAGSCASPTAPAAPGSLHHSAIRSLMSLADERGAPELSWATLRAMCLLMFFAGHDTSSSTLALLLWRLAGCPAALQRLRREQQVGAGAAPGRA